MWRQFPIALRMMLVLTVLTGVIYPGVVTALCQWFFYDQANGSLVVDHGQVVGSRLIGQNFNKDLYFHPRPSAAAYDAQASGGTNDGPTSQKLINRVEELAQKFRRENPDFSGPIPADLITTSFSGLDPHISPASAEAQAPRVAQARRIPLAQLRSLIARRVEGRDLGFLGESRVNVLLLNRTLDQDFPLSDRKGNR